MIKKTLYFENPAYLSLKNKQLLIRLPEVETSNVPDSFKEEAIRTIPIEDIGLLILDNSRITITHGLLEALLSNNVALLSCGSNHMPLGLQLPLEANSTQSERTRAQIEASLPLKKQLWQQIVQAKIENQAHVLQTCRNLAAKNMLVWAKQIKSGDSENLEGRAAAYYWPNLFGHIPGFRRDREGPPPNHLLNYGYAVLRAVVARSLVGSGLFPALGIHHRNRYNAFCLADDVMEPFRPFVDKLVAEMEDDNAFGDEINKQQKIKLLGIPVLDVMINDQRSPLMIAAMQTSASLARCYLGEIRKVALPEFE